MVLLLVPSQQLILSEDLVKNKKGMNGPRLNAKAQSAAVNINGTPLQPFLAMELAAVVNVCVHGYQTGDGRVIISTIGLE